MDDRRSFLKSAAKVLRGNKVRPATTLPKVTSTQREPVASIDDSILGRLTCPKCKSSLAQSKPGSVICSGCTRQYAANGVVDLLIDKSLRSALEDVAYDETAAYNDRAIAQIGTMWSKVFDKAGIDVSGKTILEIGAGTGALTIAMLRSNNPGQIYATDISEQFLRKTLERTDGDARVITVRCDCNHLPVYDGSFDLIVGRSILHHLLDYDRVLAQCARILAPGATAIFFEPMLEGKLTIAMYASMIVDLAKRDKDPDFSEDDFLKIEKTVRHITKESWYPQTRNSLAKLEDKYIFTLPGLRRTGLSAGFSKLDFYQNNDNADPSLWPNFLSTMHIAGVDREAFNKYQFLCTSYGRTFGAFDDFRYAPMGYFCFTK